MKIHCFNAVCRILSMDTHTHAKITIVETPVRAFSWIVELRMDVILLDFFLNSSLLFVCSVSIDQEERMCRKSKA